ncbi:MAG: class I SAM-dependent methyltransferase [Actinomycetota bacterium]
MNKTPGPSDFDSAYENYAAPWVIGEPQPAVVELERDGWFSGSVLDVGCGAGEHTIHLTRLGYRVLGIDASVPAIDHARANAQHHGVGARFEVADALNLGGEQFDTILDSALFHIFDPADRAPYVASLGAACKPGGVVHVLALSDDGPGFGPEVSDEAIRQAFGEGWELEAIAVSRYLAVATAEHHIKELGYQKGERVELPAWLARIRRV